MILSHVHAAFAVWPKIFQKLPSHFLFCGAVSLPKCALPYIYRNILEMVFN